MIQSAVFECMNKLFSSRGFYHLRINISVTLKAVVHLFATQVSRTNTREQKTRFVLCVQVHTVYS